MTNNGQGMRLETARQAAKNLRKTQEETDYLILELQRLIEGDPTAPKLGPTYDLRVKAFLTLLERDSRLLKEAVFELFSEFKSKSQ